MRRGADGIVRVQLIETDFANDVRTAIGSRMLNVGSNDQIVLRLVHDADNPGTINAAFDLLTGGVVMSTVTFSEFGQIFGTETPGFTGDDEVWTRAQVVVYTPEEADSTLNGTYGSLVINQAGQWTYVLANGQANVQALAQGETVHDTFQVQVTDEHGATDTETVTVAVSGSNDAPTVGAAVTGGGAEGSGNASINLLDFASDVDHGAVLHIENVVWDEVPGSMPAGFSLVGNTIVVDTNSLAYNAMAVGDTFATHFTYNVVDEHGAATVQHATVTITGTNDAPTVSAEVTAAGPRDRAMRASICSTLRPTLITARCCTSRTSSGMRCRPACRRASAWSATRSSSTPTARLQRDGGRRDLHHPLHLQCGGRARRCHRSARHRHDHRNQRRAEHQRHDHRCGAGERHEPGNRPAQLR